MFVMCILFAGYVHLPNSKARLLEVAVCDVAKPSLAVGKMVMCRIDTHHQFFSFFSIKSLGMMVSG